MKLRNKINLYTVFLFALLLVAMNLTVYYSFNKLILDSEMNTTKKEMVNTTVNVGKSLGTIPNDSVLRSYLPLSGMLQLVSADNGVITKVTTPTENDLSTRKAVYYPGDVGKTIEFQDQLYILISMPIIMPDGSVANLQLTKSMKTATDILAILKVVLSMVTLLALIPVLISSRVLSNLITMPVTSIIKAMTEIRQSGRFKRLELKGSKKDELFQMGETFNHMIELLELNFEKQQQFVSNASHELKTPLTIIESYASLLKRRGLKEPQLFQESLEAIHSETIRMKEMTEQLLLLARTTEKLNIDFNKIHLNEFIHQTVKAFQYAYNREINFINEPEAPTTIETDGQKLKQLLFIFLDNARKYSDGTISVVTGKENDKAFIKIIDQGMGIDPEELPKVFDRFYRIDKARSRKQGGTGLGLSIAKEMAEAINVKLQLDSIPGIGTTATIYL